MPRRPRYLGQGRSSDESGPARAGSAQSKTITSLKWSGLSRLGIQAIQLGSQLVLARLLTPADFGYAAIAIVVANFALLLSDLGVGAALIHGEALTRQRIDTAFWLNAIAGAALAAVVVVLASPFAQALHQPAAAGPLAIAGLTCGIAIYAVPLALIERRMEMRQAALIETIASLCGAAVGIVAASLGAGAFAIVSVPFSTALVNSTLYLVGTRYIPRSFISGSEALSILRFSRGLIGFNIINYFTRNTDNLLIGRFSTSAQLGFYTRAFALMLLPVSQVQIVIGRVLFPALTRLRTDLPRLRQAHRRSLLISAALCAPLSVGAASTSRDLVLVLFGDRWLPMVPMLAILSITGVQQVFQGTVGTLFQAVGATGTMFRWNLLFTGLTLLAFFIGIQWGALGICWAVFIRGWALLPLTLVVPLHLIGERLRSIARLLAPLIICLVAEGVAVYGTQLALSGPIQSAIARLVVETLVGIIVYFLALRVTLPSVLRDLIGLARRSRGEAV